MVIFQTLQHFRIQMLLKHFKSVNKMIFALTFNSEQTHKLFPVLNHYFDYITKGPVVLNIMHPSTIRKV